jgi:phosphoribosylformimino-5-aminoimidazole carboxamide ribotide isomerase
MLVVGVLDLRHGLAVRARGGRRDEYAPVKAVAGSPIACGDALALARTYTARFGVSELYAADLDAIQGGSCQEALVRHLAAIGPLWLDAGIASPEQANRAIGLGAARVVVGLETLPSYEALDAICAATGGTRVAFSLDLRSGEPVGFAATGNSLAGGAAAAAARAAAAGAEAIIVLDLDRVGSAGGLDFGLIARVREAAPAVALFAGGGVRDASDLARLAEAGCDGALVATALVEGRIDAVGIGELRAARRPGRERAP